MRSYHCYSDWHGLDTPAYLSYLNRKGRVFCLSTVITTSFRNGLKRGMGRQHPLGGTGIFMWAPATPVLAECWAYSELSLCKLSYLNYRELYIQRSWKVATNWAATIRKNTIRYNSLDYPLLWWQRQWRMGGKMRRKQAVCQTDTEKNIFIFSAASSLLIYFSLPSLAAIFGRWERSHR